MRAVAERDDVGVNSRATIGFALRLCAARVGRHERAIKLSSADVPHPFSTRDVMRVVCECDGVGVASSAFEERLSASTRRRTCEEIARDLRSCRPCRKTCPSLAAARLVCCGTRLFVAS